MEHARVGVCVENESTQRRSTFNILPSTHNPIKSERFIGTMLEYEFVKKMINSKITLCEYHCLCTQCDQT